VSWSSAPGRRWGFFRELIVTKAKKRRVYLTMTAAQKRKLEHGKPPLYPLASWVFDLAFTASSNFELLGGASGCLEHRKATYPDPAGAPASGSGEEVSEEVLPSSKPGKRAAKKSAPLASAETCAGVISYLNDKAGTNFKTGGQSARQLISARIGEGYTVADLKAVIDKKAAEWRGTAMDLYLRPATLFGREKFEQYHGQKAKPEQSRLDLTTEAGKSSAAPSRGSWTPSTAGRTLRNS